MIRERNLSQNFYLQKNLYTVLTRKGVIFHACTSLICGLHAWKKNKGISAKKLYKKLPKSKNYDKICYFCLMKGWCLCEDGVIRCEKSQKNSNFYGRYAFNTRKNNRAKNKLLIEKVIARAIRIPHIMRKIRYEKNNHKDNL